MNPTTKIWIAKDITSLPGEPMLIMFFGHKPKLEECGFWTQGWKNGSMEGRWPVSAKAFKNIKVGQLKRISII